MGRSWHKGIKLPLFPPHISLGKPAFPQPGPCGWMRPSDWLTNQAYNGALANSPRMPHSPSPWFRPTKCPHDGRGSCWGSPMKLKEKQTLPTVAKLTGTKWPSPLRPGKSCLHLGTAASWVWPPGSSCDWCQTPWAFPPTCAPGLVRSFVFVLTKFKLDFLHSQPKYANTTYWCQVAQTIGWNKRKPPLIFMISQMNGKYVPSVTTAQFKGSGCTRTLHVQAWFRQIKSLVPSPRLSHFVNSCFNSSHLSQGLLLSITLSLSIDKQPRAPAFLTL